MLKKELVKKVKVLEEEKEGLEGNICDLDNRIETEIEEHDGTKAELSKVRLALNRIEGAEDMRFTMLVDQIKRLTLRIDILTMTQEQIETMRKIKVRGRMDEPLDLPNRRRMDFTPRRRPI